MKRTLVASGAFVVLLAACGAGDGDDGFGVARPTTDALRDEEGSASSVPTDTTTEPGPTTSSEAPPSSTAAPPDTAPTDVPAATAPAGPLPVPVVELSAIGNFERPVDVVERPGDATVYVVEQVGRIVAVTDTSSVIVLDITDLTEARGERGLLGAAFHPTEDLAYVHFSDSRGDTVVAEFAVDPATGRFDRGSSREILTVEQPYSNHNGGKLAFGQDALLYIALGDGGSGGDPERYALDPSSRLGKILRIDPLASGGDPFTVPPDNPFVDVAGTDPTIWSYGLRNPWRFSFDADTGDLWIGDVGQGDFEEVNRATASGGRDAGKGVNFGWSAFEGFERFNADQPIDAAAMPLFVYDHGGGRCSIAGGAVARGASVPDLRGWYVFGDYCTGQIWALDPTAPADQPRVVELARLDAVVALVDGPGDGFYAVSTGGTVARLAPA